MCFIDENRLNRGGRGQKPKEEVLHFSSPFFNDFPFYCALDFSLVMVYSKLLVASRTGTV